MNEGLSVIKETISGSPLVLDPSALSFNPLTEDALGDSFLTCNQEGHHFNTGSSACVCKSCSYSHYSLLHRPKCHYMQLL